MISARNAPELTISRKMQPLVVVIIICFFFLSLSAVLPSQRHVRLSFFHVIIYFVRRNGDKYNVNKHGIQDSPFDKGDRECQKKAPASSPSGKGIFQFHDSTHNLFIILIRLL